MLTLIVERNDGTAGPVRDDGVAFEFRHCATDNHGNVDGLLAEMRSRRKSERLPWLGKAARDMAARWVWRMSWLNARTRSALVRHIGSTPYLEDLSKVSRIRYIPSDGSPNFAYYRAARTIPLWSHHLGDLRAEADRCANGQATGAEPIPYESRKIRDEQAERIKKAEYWTDEEKAKLLAHVARTPYLQVTERGSG